MAALSERLGRSPERVLAFQALEAVLAVAALWALTRPVSRDAFVSAPVLLMLATVSVRWISDPKGERTARFWRRPLWGTRIQLRLLVLALDAGVGAVAGGFFAAQGMGASPAGVVAAAAIGAVVVALLVAVVMPRREGKLTTRPQS